MFTASVHSRFYANPIPFSGFIRLISAQNNPALAPRPRQPIFHKLTRLNTRDFSSDLSYVILEIHRTVYMKIFMPSWKLKPLQKLELLIVVEYVSCL